MWWNLSLIPQVWTVKKIGYIYEQKDSLCSESQSIFDTFMLFEIPIKIGLSILKKEFVGKYNRGPANASIISVPHCIGLQNLYFWKGMQFIISNDEASASSSNSNTWLGSCRSYYCPSLHSGISFLLILPNFFVVVLFSICMLDGIAADICLVYRLMSLLLKLVLGENLIQQMWYASNYSTI